ncbi:MAG: hypothetical protein NMK33_05305 [Candidatus Cardinium sp.]|uniref:hypothetical protein n=1 Tax=Cardinium endosymbiont of Dermatophagoides farinae TaxID=2597823 RepID=UPI001183AC5E|nr:hypothetical protein [Cardinium endosymbiont of Dermatophagoides farinae]TSJ80829.1 hypothetical protein FPG78_02100 [Cardinium endosymbiont of Dermatophagoides farinae]UWW96834.1 MAG: hypothetical protein NMK33_05305 [Candidatus Cardinium sp.]
MEQQAKTKCKKLVISLNGCTKDDKVDKTNSDKSDRATRYSLREMNTNGIYQAEQFASQLSYKF